MLCDCLHQESRCSLICSREYPWLTSYSKLSLESLKPIPILYLCSADCFFIQVLRWMTLNGTYLFHYETYRTVVPELFGALETTPNGFTVSHSVSLCLGDMPVAVSPSYFQGTRREHWDWTHRWERLREKWVPAAWEGKFLIFTKWLGPGASFTVTGRDTSWNYHVHLLIINMYEGGDIQHKYN